MDIKYLWDYPDINYERAKRLVEYGIIKSRLVELDSFDFYKSDPYAVEKKLKKIINLNVNIDELFSTYLIVYYDHHTDKELEKEFFLYLDTHPDSLKLLLDEQAIIGYPILGAYYYYKHETTGISLRDIIKSVPEGRRREILDAFAYKLLEKNESTKEIIDMVKRYAPRYLTYMIVYMDDDDFIEEIKNKYVNLYFVLEAAYRFSTNRLRHIVPLMIKAGIEPKLILEKFIIGDSDNLGQWYDIKATQIIAEETGANIMQIYKETGDNNVKEYINQIILNQV